MMHTQDRLYLPEKKTGLLLLAWIVAEASKKKTKKIKETHKTKKKSKQSRAK